MDAKAGCTRHFVGFIMFRLKWSSVLYQSYSSNTFFREKEKQDLKSKLSELEDFKTKYEAEKRENEVQ